jgi:MHS family proline/betaine transporter-like MFS transporter
MSVLLNELFSPKTDPYNAQLLTALSFCMIFVLRPFGALIFGYIGDKLGRKVTVVITTSLMSMSCLTMFMLPTYADIGIAAAWIMLICRAVQGLSSMGEIIGAQLYLTESIKRPAAFPAVAMLTLSANFGGVAALVIASLATNYGFNWRYAFLVGAGIAIVGAVARTRLREAPDFVNAKREVKRLFEQAGIDKSVLTTSPIYNEKTGKLLPIAYFLLQCAFPACFYLVFGYCPHILKDTLGCTAPQIIQQNLLVQLSSCTFYVLLTFLSYKIYPLKIIKVQLFVYTSFILACPYLLSQASTPFEILLIQTFILALGVDVFPADPIFYKYFPIFKRFTYTGFAFALSRAIVYVITSVGLIYLTDYFGHYGLLFVMVPILLGFAFGLYYFEKLERDSGNIPNKKIRRRPARYAVQ